MFARPTLAFVLCVGLLSESFGQSPWPRHVIDGTSRGADGVRVADVNGDGLPDLTTGWEEGGVVRVYIHPRTARVKDLWPAVSVGQVSSPEDAVFVDLDGDGAMDVVSSCEGTNRTVYVHWAPARAEQYLDASAWLTQSFPSTEKQESWMYALPMSIDGQFGVDLVVGSKGANAGVGWLQAPANPRDLSAWRYQRLYDAGWIMSLLASDLDGDGDQDILISDRKGPTRGILWLENPGSQAANRHAPWPIHRVGAHDREVMFLTVAEPETTSPGHIFAAVLGGGLIQLIPPRWQLREMPIPNHYGTGKGIAVGDIDLDGRTDLVFSCENATGDKSGVGWLSQDATGAWTTHSISGSAGVKFDRIELRDLDGDGDLDVITCEERTNLGVIWYENPTR